MKKIALFIVALSALSAPVTSFATNHAAMKMDTTDGMRECALQAESLQQKITRLQSDIKKGSKAYSPEQLKNLNAKLQEANKTLDGLNIE
jgi:TolA-binding protein